FRSNLKFFGLTVQESYGFIGSNSIHPGVKFTFPFKSSYIPIDLDEGVLQNIICILVIFYNITNMPVEPFLIFTNKLPEGNLYRSRILQFFYYKIFFGFQQEL